MSTFDQNNKCHKYWLELLVRAGFADLAKEWRGKDVNDITPFEFNDDDWTDLDQLKAVVEFYLNYNDPWKMGRDEVGVNRPRLPGETNFVSANLVTGLHLVLIDSFGARNNTHGKIIAEGSASLERIAGEPKKIRISLTDNEKKKIGNDSSRYRIVFPGDTKRASGSYRISVDQIDNLRYTLALDGEPGIVNGQSWKIVQDSAWLCGDHATVTGTQLKLNGNSLRRYRGNASIQFLEDGNPAAGYKFDVIDVKNQIVKVYGLPENLAGSSILGRWKIEQGLVWMYGKTGMVERNTITLMDMNGKELNKEDLKKIDPKLDRIWFPEDLNSTAVNRVYTIAKVNKSTVVIKLPSSGAPKLTIGSQWNMLTNTVRLQGNSATVTGNIIKLGAEKEILADDKINPGFDTIYLQSDKGNEGHAYRILERGTEPHSVIIKGAPHFDDKFQWNIPAGVSGRSLSIDYNLGPGASKGYDHYDGVMFVVNDGEVKNRFRFTSYTSRVRTDLEALSIRGNDWYGFTSAPAGGSNNPPAEVGENSKFINYAFKISEEKTKGILDGARYYYAGTVRNNTGGHRIKNGIRELYPSGTWDLFIHYGHPKNPTWGTGSAGCNVSLQFYELRDEMLNLFPNNFTAEVRQKLHKKNHDQSKEARKDSTVRYNDWYNKISGKLWVIRPDELPLG